MRITAVYMFIFDLAVVYSKENRFFVGTKLSAKISLVRRISSVMPDKIRNWSTIRTRQINTILNANATIQSSTATHY